MNWSRFSWPGTVIKDEYLAEKRYSVGHGWNTLFTEQYITQTLTKGMRASEDLAFIKALEVVK